jgi:hypothetical protein
MISRTSLGRGQSTILNVMRVVVDELDTSADCDQRRYRFLGDNLGSLNSVVNEGTTGAIIRSERRSWFERVSTMAISVACETTIGYSQSEGERGWDPRGMLRPRRISLKTTASL